MKTIDAEKIYKFLLDEKIVVRNRNNVELCEGCLRITVGTPEENESIDRCVGKCSIKIMKKVLFIDRDGTLIFEPEDFQIDSFEKVKFLPDVFTYLGKIAREMDYELVMVTNQDGLGTESFPEETFYPVQNFIMQTLENEGIIFSEVFIDQSFERENLPTGKPNTGLLTKYFSDEYDFKNSFVIGDRASDMKLAENLGAKGIFIKNANFEIEENENIFVAENWQEIYEFLKLPPRKVLHERKTKETEISVELNLDGNGKSEISTGISFFDHMLEQLSRHGQLI